MRLLLGGSIARRRGPRHGRRRGLYDIAEVGTHRRQGAQGAPVASGKASVTLRLAFDLFADRVGNRLGDGVEDHHLRFPPLIGDICAYLEHAPAALTENHLCSGDRALALMV